MLERRQERRIQTEITVRVTGRDVLGNPFVQSVVASAISGSGALLSGMVREVRPGDLVWVAYRDRKARFRVVWVRDSRSEQMTQAAVHRVENEECPWMALLETAC
jgi:hypothetical protein